jgi:hypothetical protein
MALPLEVWVLLTPIYLHVESGTYFDDLLVVEYHGANILANSLGLQAIVENALDVPDMEFSRVYLKLTSAENALIQSVVDSCLETLKVSIKLHNKGMLKFAPVNVIIRVTTAAVFLLKVLNLGICTTRLLESLSVLRSAISAFKNGVPDDLHLGSRYAALIELHVLQLERDSSPESKRSATTLDYDQAGDAITVSDLGLGLTREELQFDLSWLSSQEPSLHAMELDTSGLSLSPTSSFITSDPIIGHDTQLLGDSSLDLISTLND